MNKKNLANAQFATSVNNSTTTWTVATGQGNNMPPTPFFATATPLGKLSSQSNSEIVEVTDVTGDVLTVVRAQRGTTAHEFNDGDIIANGIYMEDIDAKADKTALINALPTNVGAAGRTLKSSGTAITWEEEEGGSSVTISETPPPDAEAGDMWGDTSNTQVSDLAKLVGNMLMPVGSVYVNKVDSRNPADIFGFGTWIAYAEGRTIVGKAPSGTFSTAGATMGSETHTLTKAQLPTFGGTIAPLSYDGPFNGDWSSPYKNINLASTGSGSAIGRKDFNLSVGDNQPHNNIQPSTVAYIWERTA